MLVLGEKIRSASATPAGSIAGRVPNTLCSMPPSGARSTAIQPRFKIGAVDVVEGEHRVDVDPFVAGMEVAAEGAGHDDGDVEFGDESGVGSTVGAVFVGSVAEG